MNKRIRELAEQALFESDFDDEQNLKITMDMFAELIVKECAPFVGAENSQAVRKMFEHFGVERLNSMVKGVVSTVGSADRQD